MRSPLSVIVAATLAFTPLEAQQDTTRGRDSTARLPDLTVTTTRSTKQALDQPMALTRVNASEWNASRSLGLDDALTGVPGVLAQNRAGWSDVRLVIRGFGARGAGDRSNAGTSRGVRVLVDGFPETEPDGRTAFDLIDLAGASGIEVIRSNSSALWGNAAGGVVSMVRGGRFRREESVAIGRTPRAACLREAGRRAWPVAQGSSEAMVRARQLDA